MYYISRFVLRWLGYMCFMARTVLVERGGYQGGGDEDQGRDEHGESRRLRAQILALIKTSHAVKHI